MGNNQQMIRRIGIFGVASVLTFALTACGGSSEKTAGEEVKPVDLAVSSFMPGQHPQHSDVIEPFLKEVEKATEGRVKGTIYSGSALGKANEQYDLAVTGTAAMSMALHANTPGKFPLTSVTELPFMGKNAEDGTRIFWSLYEKFPEIAEEHEETKIAWLFKNDAAQIFTSKKPIMKMEDLKGLKIRTPSPAGTAILETFGATPVSIPMDGVYEAMQKGVVDGALAPASVITNFQLSDVTKYITKGDFYTSSLFMVMNAKTWENISLEDQKTIENLMGESVAMKAGAIYDEDGELGWKQAEDAGIEVYELSDNEKAEWEKALQPVYSKWIDEMEAKGLPGKEIYEEAVRLKNQ
ncbi:TRAP transporter substrate-binding protein [Bacillus sp. CMF12]|uniref:TRAP transporter substrate-binding protein n=1 Tax=Bacillaceae TaxID=186817 RepID=UPI001FB260BB|nr:MULTISPECIES: TRAP transporter substrate-binding protein [Bacillaceae]UOE56839.1 TRAP transporter substrate-binding protein [Cytobacillus oceanisediminis]USK51332.1 TRAP transporter substrate-binding protein [Bacillus sp. CMF12]